MRKNCVLHALLCAVFVGLFTGCCQDEKFFGYKKTSDGLYYRFHVQNKGNALASKSDFIKMKVSCYLNDSLYYAWEESNGIIYAQVSDPRFKGDLQSAFMLMREGDSASFYIKSDSIAAVYYDQDPLALGLKADDYFRYEIKMLEVRTQDAFQAEVDQMKANMENASKSALERYVKENSIENNLTESGIYLIPVKDGSGRCPEKGEKVYIDYQVRMLSGELVGSTYEKANRFSFVLGEGQVIPGLEKVLPMMRQGEKVMAVIPYELAFGEHEVGPVKPYSNLIYDIELQRIETVKEQAIEAERLKKIQKAASEKEFADYCKLMGLEKHTKSGVYYKIENERSGLTPGKGAVARIKFTAKILNGEILGTSDQLGEYYDVTMGNGSVLKGLEDGLSLMTVGENALLAVPYYLAYGDQAYNNIPAFSNIIFEVELLEIITNEEIQNQNAEKADAEFEAYLKDNNIRSTKRESGLVYEVKQKGKGVKPIAGQTVAVHYTGRFVDGRVFDSSIERNEPIEFVLGEGQVIKGWDEGIALMQKGEKGTLVIPYYLGYGQRQVMGIPAYSTLVFDVELVDIK